MTSETIKTTGKGSKTDNNEHSFIAAVDKADWNKAIKFHNSLKRRKKDIDEWRNIGRIQQAVADKSAELSSTGKPVNKEIAAFNKRYFPAINAPTLSYAKRLHANFDEIMAYRKAEKLTGTNSPMPLVQGWVNWKKAQDRAAEKLALEAKLEGLDDDERKAAEAALKAEKRAKKAADTLKGWLNTTAKLDEMVQAGMFGADDLKRISAAMASLDDVMAEQLKVKAA